MSHPGNLQEWNEVITNPVKALKQITRFKHVVDFIPHKCNVKWLLFSFTELSFYWMKLEKKTHFIQWSKGFKGDLLEFTS